MPLYTGKSADGSDMQLFGGMYTNPDNTDEWSSEPYPKQKKEMTQYKALMEYMDGRFSLNMVYKQIKEKKCPLTRSLRDYVLSYFDTNGNFITQ